MFKRFSEEKDEESRKQREFCQKQEFLDRKQESSEDTREYYVEKSEPI